MTTAYYNEHDKQAAAWLRELIKAGLIAPGEVDERDIQDVLPRELVGYTQCHFFAGIGVWSYALRCAGWPDDRRVYTGSCPCQPFSEAGQRAGFDDERHLWPAFFHLIRVNRPDVVFGEQVASKDGFAWLDIVQADLEAAGYAVGALDICAAGAGAPHIRQRLFFVADSERSRTRYVNRGMGALEQQAKGGKSKPGSKTKDALDSGATGDVADSKLPERRPPTERRIDVANGHDTGRKEATGRFGIHRQACSVGHASSAGYEKRNRERGIQPEEMGASERQAALAGGAVGGFWSNAEWIYCQDDKYRPVEPGTFPLAHGATARVGRLRGYGNAIVAPVAEEFIRAYLELNN